MVCIPLILTYPTQGLHDSRLYIDARRRRADPFSVYAPTTTSLQSIYRTNYGIKCVVYVPLMVCVSQAAAFVLLV